jgi:DNA-binding CsgD family transcriptional regulator
LGVSEGGVKSLLRRIYRKLGVPNRAALTTLVVRWQARSGAESAQDGRQE